MWKESVYVPNWRQLYLFYPPYESLGSTFLRGYISGMTSTPLGPCFPAAACTSLKNTSAQDYGEGPWGKFATLPAYLYHHQVSQGSKGVMGLQEGIFRDDLKWPMSLKNFFSKGFWDFFPPYKLISLSWAKAFIYIISLWKSYCQVELRVVSTLQLFTLMT